MNYTELKKEYVIETLGGGSEVIVCDFQSMRIANCSELIVREIQSLIAKPETKFFKVVVNE